MRLSLRAAAMLIAFPAFACGRAEGAQPPSSATLADPPSSSAAYADTVSQEGYMLCWRADDSLLHVMMSAPTTGWVAVGFHSEGAMKNANIIIGYVTGTAVHLRDDFGIDYTAHAEDVSLGGTSNLTVVGGSESNGRTSISFTIPLSTDDSRDRELVPGEGCDIIMANGPNGADGFTEKHQWVGVATISI
jgi:hypothetical protein